MGTHTIRMTILAPRRFKFGINRANSRTFTGGETNSDHDLAMVTVELKSKKNLQNHVPRHKFNLDKLTITNGRTCAVLNLFEENTDNVTENILGTEHSFKPHVKYLAEQGRRSVSDK